MNATRPIVIGIDGSPCSDVALDWAADEARLRSLPLKLVYVVDSPGPLGGLEYLTDELTTFGKDLLDDAQSRVADRHPTVPVSSAIVCDDAAHGLMREAEQERAAMLVVGSRGHGGFHDLLLGSTSLQAAMHAVCPVAVIRPKTPPRDLDSGVRGRVVLGLEGSPHSAPAAQLAFEEARLRGARLDAVHAWTGSLPEATLGVPDDALEFRAAAVLKESLAPWVVRYPDVEVHESTPKEPAAAALAAASAGAELAVVGCRARGGFTRLLLGSVSHSLIHHAHCPVLVAREPGRATTSP